MLVRSLPSKHITLILSQTSNTVEQFAQTRPSDNSCQRTGMNQSAIPESADIPACEGSKDVSMYSLRLSHYPLFPNMSTIGTITDAPNQANVMTT